MPLITSVVNATGEPSRVSDMSEPDAARNGSIAWRLRAPVATAIVNPSVLPLQFTLANAEPLRPSTHVSICFDDTTGTPRACAEPTIAFEPGWLAVSKCMLAQNAP
jgi:hypothetical protein